MFPPGVQSQAAVFGLSQVSAQFDRPGPAHTADAIFLFGILTLRLANRVAALDSGKPVLDAAFGEVTVTCEKICWLLKEGEKWLKPEKRTTSRMVRNPA